MALSPIALLGGGGMVAVAIGFVLYALVRRLGPAYLALGMLAWVVTVALKIAVAVPLNPPVVEYAGSLPQPWRWLLLLAYGGLMTGFTEVGIVWLVLRYTPLGQASWSKALAFGIGFGAIEAFLLGIGSLTAAIVGMTMPEALPAPVMEQLREADLLTIQIAPIWERFFTCLGHIGTNAMVFYAVTARRARWFWGALVFKSVIDGIATVAIVDKLLETTAAIWVMEAIAAMWGAVGLAITMWLSRRYPESIPRQLDDSDDSDPVRILP